MHIRTVLFPVLCELLSLENSELRKRKLMDYTDKQRNFRNLFFEQATFMDWIRDKIDYLSQQPTKLKYILHISEWPNWLTNG